MADKKEMLYSKIVIIVRDAVPIVVPFEPGKEKEAEEFFDKASLQWSDSFLCSVEKGPVK